MYLFLSPCIFHLFSTAGTIAVLNNLPRFYYLLMFFYFRVQILLMIKFLIAVVLESDERLAGEVQMAVGAARAWLLCGPCIFKGGGGFCTAALHRRYAVLCVYVFV